MSFFLQHGLKCTFDGQCLGGGARVEFSKFDLAYDLQEAFPNLWSSNFIRSSRKLYENMSESSGETQFFSAKTHCGFFLPVTSLDLSILLSHVPCGSHVSSGHEEAGKDLCESNSRKESWFGSTWRGRMDASWENIVFCDASWSENRREHENPPFPKLSHEDPWEFRNLTTWPEQDLQDTSMDCERDNSSMNIHHGINSQVLKLVRLSNNPAGMEESWLWAR